MPRYEFVLLDADETLFDFQRSERAALCQVLTARGYPTDETTIARYLSINSALWAANARGEIGLEQLTVERFASFVRAMGGNDDPQCFDRDYQAALGTHSYLLSGAEEFCRTLRENGCTLAIVTNGLPVPQRGRFERSPLRDVVSELFVSLEMGCQKPQRIYFDRVCAALGITDRSRAVVMGDGLYTDVFGGQCAELDTIWLTNADCAAPDAPQPTYTVHTYEEALTLILA